MMNIICATDNNYVQHCGVMLTSLFENNKGEEIVIYVFTAGLSAANLRSLRAIVEERYFSKLICCHISPEKVRDCPVRDGDHLSIAAYYRLMAPEILPVEATKALYLDCDIIVNSSLRDLWAIDLSNFALGAVDEMGCHLDDVFDRLGYDRQYGYFNSGVLLFNCTYWRDNNLVEKCFDFIQNHNDRIKFHDQDVLNAILHANCLHISCKWNMEEAFFWDKVVSANLHNSDLLKAVRNPSVLHYTWKPKPWEPACFHPMKHLYYRYLGMTQWKSYNPGSDLIKEAIHLLKTLLENLRLYKRIYYK